jgi:drug/metabolite transporter (DMT)-like permease
MILCLLLAGVSWGGSFFAIQTANYGTQTAQAIAALGICLQTMKLNQRALPRQHRCSQRFSNHVGSHRPCRGMTIRMN